MNHCFYIGIEELAANAMVKIIDRGYDKEGLKISLSTLEKYGDEVIRELERRGEKAALLLSRDRTLQFIRFNSDLFELHDFPTRNAHIVLRSGVTVDDLVERFFGDISISVQEALNGDEALNALGGESRLFR